MTALLSPRAWIAIALAAALAFSHFFVYRSGKASVRADFDAYQIAQTKALQQAEAKFRATEQEWQVAANQTTKAKDEAIQNIRARLDDAVGKLRDRPQRPASGPVPAPPSNCPSTTGAQLLRDDAEFLVRLAARADTIAAERDACYSLQADLQAR
ncbi:hypothetical protein D9M72_369780 [compost metagenome]